MTKEKAWDEVKDITDCIGDSIGVLTGKEERGCWVFEAENGVPIESSATFIPHKKKWFSWLTRKRKR